MILHPDRRTVLAGLGAFSAGIRGAAAQAQVGTADLILFNGKITTLDRQNPQAEAIAIRGGPLRCSGDRARRHATRWFRHATHRPQGPPRHSRADRQPHARHPRRAQLQHGAALGWRAIARRRDADAQGAGCAHACSAMGPRRRRLHGASVCREAAADARRDQRDSPRIRRCSCCISTIARC